MRSNKIGFLRRVWIGAVVLGVVLLVNVSPTIQVTARQQPQPSAKDILLAADKACLQVATIKYDFDQELVQGSKAKRVAKGTIYQARAAVPKAGFMAGKYDVTGTLSPADLPAQEFEYSYNGSVFRMLDPDSKSVLVIKSPTSYVVGQMLGMEKGLLGITAFSSPDPFKAVMDKADKLDVEGATEIDGVSCQIIAITQTFEAGGRKVTSTARWYIGANDHLPRRIETLATRFTARNLRINPPIEESRFFVKMPDGYGEQFLTGKKADIMGLLGVDMPAPDWTLPDAQGHLTSLKDYRGKIVVIDFWGTWCVPCRKSMPHIQAIEKEYKDRGVVVLGIAVHDEEGNPVAYMKENHFTYRLLLGTDEVAKLYSVSMFPTLYVIGPDGRILHAETGGRDNMESEVREVIDKALGSIKP